MERTIFHTFLATVWYVVPIFIGIFIDYFFGLPKLSFAFDYILGIALIMAGSFLIYRGTDDMIRYGKASPHPYFPPKRVVSEGIYRKIRHPIYLGWILATSGSVFFFQSFAVLEAFFIILAAVYFYTRYEEKELEKRFGRSYIEYKKKVPAWIPKF